MSSRPSSDSQLPTKRASERKKVSGHYTSCRTEDADWLSFELALQLERELSEIKCDLKIPD